MAHAIRADKVRGVHIGVVTENKEGQDNPGYRVKVKLPWLTGDETTFWARIAVPMAGDKRGTYMLPEVDDQVLVVFEHGDIERPIVIGSLWNDKQKPPQQNSDGKNNVKVIKTKSGHRIILDDKDGEEKVTIVDSTKKNKIALDAKEKTATLETADGDIEIKAAAGNVLFESGASIKIGTDRKSVV